jgi:lipid A disaccharide synthetase
LTTLEQDALSIKVGSRRQEVQTDLNKKRELVEQLIDRMNDLKSVGL